MLLPKLAVEVLVLKKGISNVINISSEQRQHLDICYDGLLSQFNK